MKKALLAAAAFVALPVMAQAQTLQYPGFYAGLEGGVNWMLKTTILNQSVSPNTGFAVGGVVGYDFVGPRVEAEVVYRNNTNNANFGGTALQIRSTSSASSPTCCMISTRRRRSSPISASAPVSPSWTATANSVARSSPIRASSAWATTSTTTGASTRRSLLRHDEPSVNGPGVGSFSSSNNNIISACWACRSSSARRRSCAAAAAAGRGAVVHGVLRLGPLEPVGAGPDHDPAGGRRLQDQGQRPHHGDRPHRQVGSGEPTTWRCRCVVPTRSRTRWCVTACRRRRSRSSASGETGLLVQTADGVREPQNRRVEIVIQ